MTQARKRPSPMQALFVCLDFGTMRASALQWRAARGGRKACRSCVRSLNLAPSVTLFESSVPDSTTQESTMSNKKTIKRAVRARVLPSTLASNEPAPPPAARAAYFPVTIHAAEKGVFCVDTSTSVQVRRDLATCLLEGVEGILQDFALAGADTRPASSFGLSYLVSMTLGLLDSMDLRGEQA
jgi:hypothetical protein